MPHYAALRGNMLVQDVAKNDLALPGQRASRKCLDYLEPVHVIIDGTERNLLRVVFCAEGVNLLSFGQTRGQRKLYLHKTDGASPLEAALWAEGAGLEGATAAECAAFMRGNHHRLVEETFVFLGAAQNGKYLVIGNYDIHGGNNPAAFMLSSREIAQLSHPIFVFASPDTFQ